MYERMLNKQMKPTIDEMTVYSGNAAQLFTFLNEWLSNIYETVPELSFPYGNQYGWCITHRKKKKLMCHIFVENGAFTVMMRLSNKQFESVYDQLQEYAQGYIDNKYPCGDGGWIHYRVTCKEMFQDVQTLLSVKCSL